MEFRKFLQKQARELDKEVGKILKEQLCEARKTDKKLVPLIKAFARSCQGGKRIRGTLVMLGYEIGKKSSVVSRQSSDKTSLIADSEATIHETERGEAILKADSSIIKIAAAYEIIHTAILVHDDIIDQSPMRRDKPSLHEALGGNHYGISQAISLGDFGFFLGFKIISETNFPKKSKIKALELFSKVMMDTTWGEMLDLEKADPKIVISGACTNYVVMKLKTAYYTISGPLQMGAILGGGNQDLIRVLGVFGENLGIAFQIQDDILDEEEKFPGKAKQQAIAFKNKATKALPEITKDPKMSTILEQMGEYLVERKK